MCFLFSISHVYPRKADRSNPACRVLPRTHNKAIKRVNTLIPASSLRLCSRASGTPQKTGRPPTPRTAPPASPEPRSPAYPCRLGHALPRCRDHLGSAHVLTPVPNAHLLFPLLLSPTTP